MSAERQEGLAPRKGRRTWPRYTFHMILVSLTVLVVAAVLVYVQIGRSASLSSDHTSEMLAANEVDVEQVKRPAPTDCLLVWDSTDASSASAAEAWRATLKEMRVGYDQADASLGQADPTGYRVVVLALQRFPQAGEWLDALAPWVASGGNLLVANSLAPAEELSARADLLGIRAQDSYAEFQPKDFASQPDFMVGAQQAYTLPFMAASLDVTLSSGQALAQTSDGRPLVWANSYGAGRVVSVNMNPWSKMGRGVFAQAYSRLGSSFAYPVIDAATYYLDDCPSPVPAGTATYIDRDYHMTVEQFYTSVWWPDMSLLAQRHDVSYTGALIETYSDETDGTFQRPESNYSSQYIGSMLLSGGGELAIHGYNHQPLVLDDGYYQHEDTYKTWKDQKALDDSLREVEEFAAQQFPTAKAEVYVPPSNILSPQGRDALGRNGGIRAIASVYIPGGDAYDQEYTVSRDGIVEAPRVTSGELVEGESRFAALSELNAHYVVSHFVHPDDALNESRGASAGWEAMCDSLGDYMDWVDESAPDIRHLTGSGMAGAVQRFALVTPRLTETDEALTVELDGFVDDARLLVRLNDFAPGKVEGGSLTQLSDTLYLLDANAAQVTIGKEPL